MKQHCRKKKNFQGKCCTLREFWVLLKVDDAESCWQNFAEGYQRMAKSLVVGGVLETVMLTCVREKLAVKLLLVHFESSSNVSLALCSVTQEPENL